MHRQPGMGCAVSGLWQGRNRGVQCSGVLELVERTTTTVTILEHQPRCPFRCTKTPPGVLRVGNSRVLLELVIRAFQRGQTPEGIVESYDTLGLPDVYAVVSYYLANPAAHRSVFAPRDAQADDLRRKIEASQPSRADLRQLIMARARAKGLLSDQAGE